MAPNGTSIHDQMEGSFLKFSVEFITACYILASVRIQHDNSRTILNRAFICPVMQGVRSGPYWFWQLFKRAHGLVSAHTAAPSQGGCADKWVKGAEVFCVRTLYEGHFPPVFLQQRTEIPRETIVNRLIFATELSAQVRSLACLRHIYVAGDAVQLPPIASGSMTRKRNFLRRLNRSKSPAARSDPDTSEYRFV